MIIYLLICKFSLLIKMLIFYLCHKYHVLFSWVFFFYVLSLTCITRSAWTLFKVLMLFIYILLLLFPVSCQSARLKGTGILDILQCFIIQGLFCTQFLIYGQHCLCFPLDIYENCLMLKLSFFFYLHISQKAF